LLPNSEQNADSIGFRPDVGNVVLGNFRSCPRGL
jgi:hypothetical protein